MTLASLVLATDGSADAVHARRAAADIARATGAEVHVVNAWNIYANAYANAYAFSDDLAAHFRAEAGGLVEAERAALVTGGERGRRARAVRAAQRSPCSASSRCSRRPRSPFSGFVPTISSRAAAPTSSALSRTS